MFPNYLWGADWTRYKSPVLRNMTVVGYMQSGKTTYVRYLARLMYKYATRKGADDSEIAYIETPSLKRAKEEIKTIIDIERTRYLMLFVDDAIKSAHSRRHNILETQLFSDIRHWSMRKGVLIVVYATQDFRLLDRLMRSAMIYSWKSLPFEYWIGDRETRRKIHTWIGDPDIVRLLEAITQAIYSNNPEKSISALQTAVVRIPVQRWGPRPVKGILPLTPPSHIWHRITEQDGEGETQEEIDTGLILHALIRLLKHLRGEKYLLKWNRGKYLIIKTPKGREISLGPLGENPKLKQIINQARRQNEYS